MARPKKEQPQEPLEKQLWSAADKLRKNIDAAEYKHVVLGLIFLKYISDSFSALHALLQSGEGDNAGADPEDKDEYTAQNVFFVPQAARCDFLRANARKPEIGKLVDAAMETIKRENPSLKDVLPKVYARQNLDPASLGGLIDLVSNIAFEQNAAKSADVLGHVFEYFLGEFALAEGKKGGQFYTPRCIVELFVPMLGPYHGRVMDPCCGSGGVFVQSEKFVREHQGSCARHLHLWAGEQPDHLAAGENEPRHTRHRQRPDILEQRGLLPARRSQGRAGGLHPRQPALQRHDWSGEQLRKDVRWQYGTPPPGNANFAWLQHFAFHLAPAG